MSPPRDSRLPDGQCRFVLISGPGRRRSPGPFVTGGSKFITRKPGPAYLDRWKLAPTGTAGELNYLVGDYCSLRDRGK
ncbi:hypothetical protein TNCV_716031 [Trichonephila clavipes]|nr:hypothetical protein TNCV_716031 [Trichonephila clavipes]